MDKFLLWANDKLKIYGAEHKRVLPVIKTPWSEVYTFETATDRYYLKKTSPELFIKAKILEKLASSFDNVVPELVASNPSLNCFITKNAGITLRNYLYDTSDFNYLYKALDNFLELQRQIENYF